MMVNRTKTNPLQISECPMLIQVVVSCQQLGSEEGDYVFFYKPEIYKFNSDNTISQCEAIYSGVSD